MNTTGEGCMPDKTSVSVNFRIRRPDGVDERLNASGELHRMVTGWALTCRFASPADATDDAGVADMTLVVRQSEIRMNRKGSFRQEQLFQVGEWRPGTLHTPYGMLAVEAWTHRIQIDLSRSGGSVEWEYDLVMMNEKFERCSILLDIREEQTP
jgi:uncharacterized beta-barrel protein YwiB (DUF1934 family)